jgi:hypothetical protein
MMKQLKKLAYVRKGTGSTANTYVITVKDDSDDVIEAVSLLLSVIATNVSHPSRRMFTAHIQEA